MIYLFTTNSALTPTFSYDPANFPLIYDFDEDVHMPL